MFKRPLVLGANGQLGRALSRRLGPDALAYDHRQLDVTAPDLTVRLQAANPDIVINCAAYTAVDRAESDPDLAFAVNGTAPGVIAKYCASAEIPLIHYSTDYVYSGSGVRPWVETDTPAPINQYGASKLAGDRAIAACGGRWLILRTSWVYDENGGNFMNSILRLAAKEEVLSVVDDQVGAPNYAGSLAGLTASIVQRLAEKMPFPSGVYHMSAKGESSWHGFAEAIVAGARVRGAILSTRTINKTTSDIQGRPARRPNNSRLDCCKVEKAFGITMQGWKKDLEDCLDQRFGAHSPN